MPRKPFTTRIDDALLKELKKLAIDLDVDANDLLETAIERILKENGKPIPKRSK